MYDYWLLTAENSIHLVKPRFGSPTISDILFSPIYAKRAFCNPLFTGLEAEAVSPVHLTRG